AGDRRPAARPEAAPRPVGQIADDRPGPCRAWEPCPRPGYLEDAQGRVAAVAVLGVLEGEQPLVARKAGRVGALAVGVEAADRARPQIDEVDRGLAVGRPSDRG